MEMNKNIAGFDITRPEQELIMMRGLPGSGKSHLAKILKGSGAIHSTDTVIESFGEYSDHFKVMNELEDWSAHFKMHMLNYSNAVKDMTDGVTPVVVDNTNIKLGESRNYVETALELGFDEKNIRFVDVGTGGKTLEELAERNTHNVSLEIITEMHRVYVACGPHSAERIFKTKGEKGRKVLYSGIFLDEKTRNKLLVAFGNSIPKGWETICEHVTLFFGKGFPDEMKDLIGTTINFKVFAIGKSDMAIALLVDGLNTEKVRPHITLAIDRDGGAKPVMSNEITDWKHLENYVNVSGVFKEITT